MKLFKLIAIILGCAALLFVGQMAVLWDDWKVILGWQEFLTEVPRYAPWDPDNIETRTFQTMEQQYAWQDYYDPLSPREGTEAPDFELSDISGDKSIRLSDFRGDKPVALVFGSFT